MQILHPECSITGDHSVSRTLSAAVTQKLQSLHRGARIVYRDLVADPLPHASLAELGKTDTVDEFLASDIIVVGAPMYNFTVPSQLKAWIDRIALVNKTFRYTEQGPEGLAGGRKVVIASSRGGVYSPETPFAALDLQEHYLRTVFGFMGIHDVQVVRAEGIAMGEEAKEIALQNARDQVDRLAA